MITNAQHPGGSGGTGGSGYSGGIGGSGGTGTGVAATRTAGRTVWPVIGWIGRWPVASFFVLAYLLSWSWWWSIAAVVTTVVMVWAVILLVAARRSHRRGGTSPLWASRL